MDKDAVWGLWKALMGESLQYKLLGSWSKAMTPAAESCLSFEGHLLGPDRDLCLMMSH